MSNKFFKILNNKSVSLLLIVSILSTTILSAFPQKAEAQWVVVDPALIAQVVLESKKTILERIIDGGARVAANIAIQRIVSSTVQWASSGFEGNPAYVTDPAQYFTDIADGVAGKFIAEDKDLGFLCSPFQANIKLSLLQSYYQPPSAQFQCTLTKVVGNIEDFYQSFDKGGWDAWISMTQTPTNNPYGAYIQARIEMDSRIAQAIGLKQNELSINSGYMSWANCVKKDKNTGKCLERGKVLTPGGHIKAQLDKVLPAGLEKLISVQHIEDLMEAFAVGILQRYVFGPQGLFAKGGTSNNGAGSPVDVDGDGVVDGIDTDRDGRPDVCYFGGVSSPSTPPCRGSRSSFTPPSYIPDPEGGGGGEQCTVGGNSYSSVLRSAMDSVLVERPDVAQLPNVESGGRQNARTFLALVEAKLISMGYQAADDVLNGNNNPNTGDLIAVWRDGDDNMERYDAIIGSAATIASAATADQFTGFVPLNCTSGGGGNDCGCNTNGNTPPGEEPEPLLQDLQTERAKYGATMTEEEIGKLLNTVAWNNRINGWRLLGKAGGANCPSPAGPRISCDFLVHQPTMFGYDVLRDVGGESAPVWLGPDTTISGQVSRGERTLVAPVTP